MNHRPFIILKQALSLDGYLDDEVPHAFSDDQDKRIVHVLRSLVDGVLVGAETARNDNPTLIVNSDLLEHSLENQVIRIVLEGQSKLSQSLNVLSDRKAKTIVFRNKINIIQDSELPYEQISYEGERLDIHKVLSRLWDRGLRSILVEGGARVIEQFLNAQVVDLHRMVFTPHLIQNASATKVNVHSNIYKDIKPSVRLMHNMYEAWFALSSDGEQFYSEHIDKFV